MSNIKPKLVHTDCNIEAFYVCMYARVWNVECVTLDESRLQAFCLKTTGSTGIEGFG